MDCQSMAKKKLYLFHLGSMKIQSLEDPTQHGLIKLKVKLSIGMKINGKKQVIDMYPMVQ